jgi:hypothetical protein
MVIDETVRAPAVVGTRAAREREMVIDETVRAPAGTNEWDLDFPKLPPSMLRLPRQSSGSIACKTVGDHDSRLASFARKTVGDQVP